MLRRLIGKNRRRRAVEIAAQSWNSTSGENWEGRARIAKLKAEEECSSVFTTLIAKIALHIAIKLITKWAEENLFSATAEDIDNAC